MTDFQKSVHKLKNERELLNNQLRDVLAKNGSLRRKDYDKMMESILSFLEKKEIEAEKLFCEYVVRQKSMASTLKAGLLNISDPHAENAPEKIKQFKQELQQVTKSQEERKECIMNQFLIFQEINNNVTNKLKELLGKGGKICAKDVKVVVKDLINNSIV